MSKNYLFGPVTPAFADQYLAPFRSAGNCLTFGPVAGVDLVTDTATEWAAIEARFSPGWRPDFVALYLPYTTVPHALWSAPVPLVGLAADWNLLFHQYRAMPPVELLLTDTTGVGVFAKAGISDCRAANLFGCAPAFVQNVPAENERTIDLLFVGNLHPAVQHDRLPWLGRLARFADRYTVVIRAGVFGDEYRELLARSRIVFNRSVRGECNQRVAEAVGAGALLFQEADNREVPGCLRMTDECILYTDESLEEMLEHYLTHEDERADRAAAGRARADELRFDRLWERQLDQIGRELPEMTRRAARRPRLSTVDFQRFRTWQALGAAPGSDPRLVADLAAALVASPRDAALHHALGLVELRNPGPDVKPSDLAARAAGYFGRALTADPGHLPAALSLALALANAGKRDEAVEAGRRLAWATLSTCLADRHVDNVHHIHEPVYPATFDFLRVEWEKAGWQNVGHPAAEAAAKGNLLRWRVHCLLAQLTGEIEHHYEAVAARPDLPTSRAALGVALANAGQPRGAASHLARAVEANPFDAEAARLLFRALGESGDGEGQRSLAAQRRLLRKASPEHVAAEEWIERVPPPAGALASIIVLCCNELAYTKLCLESVLKHTRAPYELVLVDNGSTDRTLVYLEDMYARPGPEHVVVSHNETNLGFPAGVNQGLARARGEYLVLLNNDTVVTPGWLEGLVGWVTSGWPKTGLVGPTSNYAPPPQLVPAGYGPDLAGLDAFAARRAADFANKGLEVARLTGFCLLLTREALGKIGTLDERFGLGFFDDDDWCVRARRAELTLVLAQGVYVHHFGSRTMTGLGLDGTEHLRRNFEQFKDKWGEEEAARYQLPRLPEVSPDVVLTSAPSHAVLLSRARSESSSGVSGQAPPAPANAAGAVPLTPLEDSLRARLGEDRGTNGPGDTSAATAPEQESSDGTHILSICLIVKNEEKNLPDCLASIAGLDAEIIVVDTGSTDATKEIAGRFGAKVFDFAWIKSFAAARNECLKHATGNWIFWLDADDRLDEEYQKKLAALVASLPTGDAVVAFSMKCRCLPDPETGTATLVDHVRLFPNREDIRWKYRVHEQILPAVKAAGGQVFSTDIVVQHTGYLDPVLRKQKLARDRELLELEIAENADDPFVLFNLGWSLDEEDRHAEALPHLTLSLELSQPADSIVRKLYALILGCHRRLGRPEKALAVCREGRRLFPEDAQLLYQEAALRLDRREYAAAEACLLRLLTGRDDVPFASVAEGLRGFRARLLLGVVYSEQGRDAEAVAQWRAALAEAPGFLPALRELGELYLASRRWDDLERLAGELEQAVIREGRPGWEGAALRARAWLARQEFPAAQAALERLSAEEPRALLPRILLSYAYLQEGRQWGKAEQALRGILEIDPANAEAKNNLAILLRDHPPNGPAH